MFVLRRDGGVDGELVAGGVLGEAVGIGRPPIDRVVLYRTFAAELQHGERGARSRAARRLRCSRQYVDQVVREIESARPFASLAVGVATRNTADTPIMRPEPSEQPLAIHYDVPPLFDPDDLVYRDPPGAYPRREPITQIRAESIAPLLDMLIMSNPEPKAKAKVAPKQQAFELNGRRLAGVSVQLQPCASGPIANARLAANLSIAAAWFLTALSYVMMHVDLRLVWLWLPTVGGWAIASVSQRELRRRTIGA